MLHDRRRASVRPELAPDGQHRGGGPAELVVLDGEDLSAPPVARVHLPARVPDGFHGAWVPDASVPPDLG